MASLWAQVENEYPEAAVLTRVTAAAAVSDTVTVLYTLVHTQF